MNYRRVTATAVALLLGTVFAAAQGTPQRQQGSSSTDRGGQGGQMQGQEQPQGSEQGQPGQRNQTDGQRGNSRAQGQPRDRQTTGQSENQQGQQPRGEGGNSRAPGQPGQTSGQREQGRTSGQGQREPGQASGQQNPQNQTTGQERNERGPNQGREQSPTTGQGSRAAGSATITTEQRTRIRETVLKGGKAPRVSSVNFSISVGTAVPRSVKLVVVPREVVEIHPAWRGYMYFVYEDEIIIVNPRSHEIVAIIEA